MKEGGGIADVDPMLAVRYQIVVVNWWLHWQLLTATVVLNIVYKRCFGKGQQPLLKLGR